LEEKRTEECKMNSYDMNIIKKPSVGGGTNDQKEKELKELKEKELREKEMRDKNQVVSKVEQKMVNPYMPYNVIKKPEAGVYQRPASANVVDNRPKTPILQNNYNNYAQKVGNASPLHNNYYQRNIQVAQQANKNLPIQKPVPVQQPKPISSRPQSAKVEIKQSILYNKPPSPKPMIGKYDNYNNRSPVRRDISPIRNNPLQNNPLIRPPSGQDKRAVIEKINYVGAQQRMIGKADVIPRSGINNPLRPIVAGNPINKPITPVKGYNNNRIIPNYGGPKIVHVKK
jgi:hypothetical protein